MIIVKDGKMHVEGDKVNLLAELTVLMRAFLKEGVADNVKELHEAVDTSALSMEELTKKVIDEIDKMDDIGLALAMLGDLTHFLTKETS